MFGEESDSSTAKVLDGTSNTIAIAESTLDVLNGTRAAWGYRAWVQVGIDVASNGNYNPATGVATGTGINKWWRTAPTEHKFGRIGDWNWAGSLHPGGCQVTMGDGSVRFLRETTSLVTLNKLAAMADGHALGDVP
jgi:prepilin-type processing-associated H-X9-DG protein